MGLIIRVAQSVSIFRAKLWKTVVEHEIVIFWIFVKMYIFEIATFYLVSQLTNHLNFFSGSMYL